MFNVLPENLKADIKSQYRTRFAVTVLMFIIFLQVVFLISLFPSWFLSMNKENDALTKANSLNAGSLSQSSAPASSVAVGVNEKLRILNTVVLYPQLVPLITAVLVNKPSDIHLNSFTYTSKDATDATLTVAGVSSTRETLVSFVKSLQNSGAFKTAVLPVSDLAKDTNIEFSIDLSIAP